ncbi:MAG TPA: glycosyltransferase [Bacteroidales bacterium]|nr:glycosyltransferase [Bacteroidales bacterium]
MKILFVIDTLGSGGKERRLTELLKALVPRREVTAELVVMSDDIHYSEIFDLGIRIHKIIRHSRKDLLVFNKLRTIIKEFKPDTVHCWESMTAVYLAPLCKIFGCPLINGMVTNVPTRRNILNRHWLRARLTFPFSEVIVSNSRAGIEAYRVPPRKGVVIYNGFNFQRVVGVPGYMESRKLLGISSPLVVGMVASFWQQKDYPTFFAAAQILLRKRSDLTFLAVGTGTDSRKAMDYIDSELLANFRLMGKQSNVETIISTMDVCVLATFTEGTSNAILEYMAMGKPVVATAGGGTTEIIDDGVNGFLVLPSDPEILATKIQLLLDDTALRRIMGQAGLIRIKEAFSIDRMVDDYLSLYRRVTTPA